MLSLIRRELIYLAYYFEIQLGQILPYWMLGIVIGSVISVFGKQRIHQLFSAMQKHRLGAFGVIPASLLGPVYFQFSMRMLRRASGPHIKLPNHSNSF